MTREDLIRLLSERFYDNFADETARAVLGADAVDLLYAVAVDPHPELPTLYYTFGYTASMSVLLPIILISI